MAAGQGFKNFSTGDVLTASDVNGYLMQGIWVFANAAARTSAVTSPQEGNVSFLKDTNALEIYDGAAWVAYGAGDITEVTAGTGISGGGTAGAVTITNSMATAIDAKGDLIAGTGADTFSRLAVGSNDQVLTADSSTATGLKWAAPAGGAMTLLFSGTASGSAIDMNSISGSYRDLYFVFQDFWPSSTVSISFAFNGTSYANANTAYWGTNSDTASTINITASNAFMLNNAANILGSNQKNMYTMYIYDYTNTTASKNMISTCQYVNGSNSLNTLEMQVRSWLNTSAITRLYIYPNSGNFGGGTYYLYGVK